MSERSTQKRSSPKKQDVLKKPRTLPRSKDILRALMDPTQPDMSPWSSTDLQVILNHQLATPLDLELDQLAETAQCSRDEASAVIDSCGSRTFGELLCNPSPSGRALQMLKDYAKKSLKQPVDIPREVARVLYVTAILRGRQAGVANITSLDNATIEREAGRCLTFGWLPAEIRGLLRTCLPDKR